MKRPLIALAIAATVLLAGFTTPAEADRPERSETTVTFVDLNPCTGEEHEVTINFELAIHRHEDRRVVNVKRSGSTSDGFEMEPGSREHVTVNDNWVIASFRDKWSNDDGAKFRAQGRLRVNQETGEVVRDEFDLFCPR